MAKRSITIEDLAGMVKIGFDETAKKYDLDLLTKRVINIEKRTENIEKLLLRQHGFQIKELEKRIKRMEDLFALK